MKTKTLAHVSDLHLGHSPARERAAAMVVERLLEQSVDHVVVTGDLTHSGSLRELAQFERVFAPLSRQGRLTVVPGNHDRGTDDVAEHISLGRRVWVERRAGLHLTCIDSTAPHNRTSFRSHGELCARTLDAVTAALDAAPTDALRVVLLHHHLLPLPVEGIGEWFAEAFGWPHAAELPLGRALLARLLGRCDLVLHGHRHVPRQLRAQAGKGGGLPIFNAGSTTQLLACRIFDLAAHERPQWLQVAPAPKRSPVRMPPPVVVYGL